MDIAYLHISPNLQRFVSCVWASKSNNEVKAERILPDGGSTLIFNFGDAVTARRADGSITTWSRNFLAGLTTSFLDLTYHGSFEQVGVIFKPFGAFHLMNTPMSEFLDSGVELDLVDKYKFQKIYDEMASAEDLHRRLALVCSWLELAFSGITVDSFIPSVTCLLQKQDEISVNEIAGQMGRSQQHIARLFNKYTGTSPKKLQRIFRFQKVLHTLTTHKTQLLTSTAYDFNYSDQSHFNNEIRSMSGYTPLQLLKQNVLGSLRVVR